MMKTFRSLLFGIGCLFLVSLDSWGDTLSIGSMDSLPGATIEVPVNVSVSQDLVGLHLRLKFDPAVFLSPRVIKGPLLSNNHLLDVFSPQEGEWNIVVFSPQANTPFESHDGIILYLRMSLSEDAPAGSYPIGFAAPVNEPLVLLPSGLSGTDGVPIAHSLVPGSVRILGSMAGDMDGNQTLNDMDLMLFSAWWRDLPDSTNSPGNLVPSLPVDFIDVRDLVRFLKTLRDYKDNQ